MGSLKDPGEVLVQGTGGENRVSNHPGVPRAERASKDRGLTILKLEKSWVNSDELVTFYSTKSRRNGAFDFRQVEFSQVLKQHGISPFDQNIKLGFSGQFCWRPRIFH